MITLYEYLGKVKKTYCDCWIYPTRTNQVWYKDQKINVIKAIFDLYGKEYDGLSYRSCGNSRCVNPAHLMNSKEFFWTHVWVQDNQDECWEWKSACGTGDYGNTTYKGVAMSASRVAYIIAYGEIESSDIYVCHKCDNPPCCNPHHLFLGTRQDNVDDRERKGRNKLPHSLGEQHGLHKLTEAQVKEIRRLHDLGYSYNKLYPMFGVSKSCIRDVIKNNNWSWMK